jgi:RNA polymerase sigma factor for flagellar operon FliA
MKRTRGGKSKLRSIPAAGVPRRHGHQKPRTDLLVSGDKRPRAVSPVSAPLVFPRPAPARPAPEDRQRRESRAAKRQLEERLWREYFETHGEDARNALWVHYQGLVRYIAERQKAKLPECIDLYDLVSAGNMGLMDAIGKFDAGKGVKFETYCVPRIRGAMVDSIRAADWVPRLIRNKGHQFERLVAALATEFGREPTDEELAERLGMDLQRLAELRNELDVKAQISFEGAASDGADERDLLRLEMLEDREVVEPTRELQREEIRKIAFTGLHYNEKWVVEQYYFHGRSMKDIGDDLHLSESRICQIHAQVLEVLKRKFRAYQESCVIG